MMTGEGYVREGVRGNRKDNYETFEHCVYLCCVFSDL